MVLDACRLLERKRLTLDEFFDYKTPALVSVSPNGEYVLLAFGNASWSTNTNQYSLWLYSVSDQTKKLISSTISPSNPPQWSPKGDWIVLSQMKGNVTAHPSSIDQKNQIYLYSITLDKLFPIDIGDNMPSTWTWGSNDSMIYFASVKSSSAPADNEDEWKDAVLYGKNKPSSSLYSLDISMHRDVPSGTVNLIQHLPFLVGELAFAPSEKLLVMTSTNPVYETMEDFEIYSLKLGNASSLLRMTYNEGLETGLRVSSDGHRVFFLVFTLSSPGGKFNDTQQRLYSVDLRSARVERWGKEFDGEIVGHTVVENNGILILGQLGTEVHIYSQSSLTGRLHQHSEWHGVFQQVSSRNNTVAFVYSSVLSGRPGEIYITRGLNQLSSAKPITNENELFTHYDLPKAKVYQWKNMDDNRTIEGILHYPPGQFESKNLPLLVLIHGGPYTANTIDFRVHWGAWALLAASEGWLVLEPNYRGSTGYGDEFLGEIRDYPLSRPGKDILFGVDRLIASGMVDRRKLAVGGYSYGGYLTNWLITQTTRFNAALSGSGPVEHSAHWGMIDIPIFNRYVFGGFPWEVPDKYHREAPLYQLNKVRTPTHIVTGELDDRVHATQNYVLARALRYLQVPVQLIIFPNEGHYLSKPWNGKIKVREELKWLMKYGYQSY